MHSEKDPPGLSDKEGSTPSTPKPTQQKRVATSPADKEERRVRQNVSHTDPLRSASNVSLNQQQPTGLESADDNTPRSAIHNQHFPTFKLLRKLNNKIITARHHKTFLVDLQQNGQVPKGLQVKSAPTGAELDLNLYQEWEEAHVILANTLRDILIRHWITTEVNLSNLIRDHTEKLKAAASAPQLTLILGLIDKANESKTQELTSRRRRKENARGTGTSAAGRVQPPPQAQDAQ